MAPELPAPLVSCGAAVHGGKIFVVAGWGRSRPLDTAVCFDPATGLWSWLPQRLAVARAVCAAAAVSAGILVVGGRRVGARATDSVELLELPAPDVDGDAPLWRAMPPMLVARTGCVAVAAWR